MDLLYIANDIQFFDEFIINIRYIFEKAKKKAKKLNILISFSKELH